MTTKGLNITLVTEGQSNKATTIATAEQKLEAAAHYILAVDLSGGDVTLNAADFSSAQEFRCSGHTVPTNLIVPLKVNGVDDAERRYTVRNDGTDTVTVKGATGATVVVPAGLVAIIQNDGTDQLSVMIGGDTPELPTLGSAHQMLRVNSAGDALVFEDTPFDVPVYWRGVLTDGCILARVICGRPFKIPASLSGTKAKAGTNATSDAVVSLQKNGSEFGTITVHSDGSYTLTAASLASFGVSTPDIFDIVGPATADVTLADLALMILGTRL